MHKITAPDILIGDTLLPNLTAVLNKQENTTGYQTHFLGSDVLKRYNIIIDFQENILYLKPNKFFSDSYFDDKTQ